MDLLYKANKRKIKNVLFQNQFQNHLFLKIEINFKFAYTITENI